MKECGLKGVLRVQKRRLAEKKSDKTFKTYRV